MQISKKIIIPMAAVAVVGAGMFGFQTVSAANDTSHRASLIQKLADELHVDKSKVQAIFDKDRSDKQAERQASYEARLSQAVTDGKLTPEQKKSILAEHDKLQAELKVAMSQTNSDRHAAMEKIRTEGRDWAKFNNIDPKWLMPAGPGRHGSMMGHGPDGDSDDDSKATSQ